MTTEHIATAIERLMGETETYIRNDIAETLSDRFLGWDAAKAVVITLKDTTCNLWGVIDEFTTLDTVEVYS